MNNVNLIGRLTKDPELKYTSGSEPKGVCRFTLAIDDGYGDNKRADFIPVVVFGKQAESCDTYLSKGRMAAVTGKIQTGSYEKDGRTIYTTDVIASRVEFIGGGEKKGESKPEPSEIEAADGFQYVADDMPF